MVYGDAFRVSRLSESASTVTRTGRWSLAASTGYLGDRALRSGTAGARVTLSFVGSQVAWFGTQAAANGRARVLLDGVPVAEVGRTRLTSTSHRRVLYRARWPQSGRHTVALEVMGTPGHPYVVVDGFVVVGPPPEDPVLVGAGDIATCGVSGASRTAALLDATPGRVFAAGDLAYPTGTAAQFRDCYGPTWGRWRLRTSPVPGNHEYLSAGAGPYFDYFGSRSGSRGRAGTHTTWGHGACTT